MEFNYDEVRRIHRLEKSSSKLVQVDQEFYNELSSFLEDEKKSYLDSLRDLSSTRARDFSNLKKMSEEIFSLREKKVLNLALVASRTNEPVEENMAVQEKRLFRDVLASLKKHNRIIEEMFSASSKPGSGDRVLNSLSVEILSDISGFVGSDMKEYGPFEKGQVVKLPLKIAKLLSERRLAEVKS